jgi:plastocyanin
MVKLGLGGLTLAAVLAFQGTPRADSSPPVRGSLSGRVTFAGSAPAPEPIDMSSEQFCQEAQRGAPAARQRVRVGAQNGLADVVVHVKGVTGGARTVPAEPVVLDQKDCAYHPSVLVVRAGQPIVIRNSDGILHNVHAFAKANPPFNIGQPIAGMEARRTMRVAELVRVRCDIHDWMEASLAVYEDPYFAVTDADGRFSIAGLPAGEYELEVWHPKLGARTQKVRVGEGAADIVVAY